MRRPREKKGQSQILKKEKTILIRLSSFDDILFNTKSDLLGIKKSQLLRDGAFHYWNGASDNDWSSKLLNTYKDADDETKDIIVDIIFSYYRRMGYPHRSLSDAELIDLMNRIKNSKCPLLEGNHLQINTSGLALANYFHQHMVKVRCLKNNLSPFELFSDDDKFKDAIRRWLDLDNKPNHAGIRRILRTRDGVRSVVNFKPVIARYIYERYVEGCSSVLDPCAGYGGRLAGLISTAKNLLYHGIDPCPETVIGNTRMAGFFAGQYTKIFNEMEWPFRFRIDLGCAEDIMPGLASESYDLVFTSPPYFDVEKYDILPNQSYLRYPTYPEWRDGFLRVLIEESCRVSRGRVILNVKDYAKYPIAADTLKIAEECGWRLERTYSMRLANSEFHRKPGQDKWHVEPIFVFSK